MRWTAMHVDSIGEWWVMRDRLDALPDDELRDLIGQSYSMVTTGAAS